MGFWDSLTDIAFANAADGKKVFYPWRTWGRGYVVSDTQEYYRLRDSLKRYFQVALSASLITFVILILIDAPLEIFLAMVAVVHIDWWFRSQKLVRGIMPTEEKMSRSQSMKNSVVFFKSILRCKKDGEGMSK
jgi:hypothetical protein